MLPVLRPLDDVRGDRRPGPPLSPSPSTDGHRGEARHTRGERMEKTSAVSYTVSPVREEQPRPARPHSSDPGRSARRQHLVVLGGLFLFLWPNKT